MEEGAAIGRAPAGVAGLGGRLLGGPARWAVVAAWLAAALALAPSGAKLADVTNDDYVLPGGSQTAQLQETLRDRFPGGDQRLVVLVYRRAGGLTGADRQLILRDAREAAALDEVAEPVPPFAPGSPPGLVSSAGDVALTLVPLVAGEVFQVKEVVEELREAASEGGGLETHVTGFPALIADVNSAIKEADLTLLGATVALVLVLLVAVYRSPLLALLPLVVVGLAYAASAGVVYLLNRHAGLPVDSTATSLLLVLMFGAGTDYCLLLVARYRTALREHERPRDAMAAALADAGPAIVASGVTVIAALLVMLAAVFGLNRTLGPVNAIGVAVVLLASLTLLPAALVALGRRAFWPNAASVAYGGPRRPEGGSAGGLWHRLGRAVRRRPAAALAASTAVLAAAALGLAVHGDAMSPVDQFRSPTDGTRGFEVVRSAFPPGTVAPTSVLVDRRDGPLRPADLAAVRERLGAVEGVAAVADTGRRSQDGRAALLTAVFADDPFGDAALERVEGLRSEAAAVDPALRVLVGQGSGERLDYREGSRRDLRVVAPLVLAVVFLTLVLLLRALVAPLYLLGTVVLSFLGTMGASLLVFDVVLGRDGIDPSLPLVVFLFLVALGSDYNIFLTSRVREEALVHGTSEGMFRGLVATGPVITSAGLVLAGTFSVLVVLPVYALVEIGFAVALGVLVDTFLVRSVCVPALVWLVGDRSWWPSRLARSAPAPVVAPAPTPPVPAPAPLPAAAAPAAPAARARVARPAPLPDGLALAVRAPDGRSFAVDGPLVVGRDPASGVPLPDDPLVSARHARLLPVRDGLVVEDLGSRNGTYVDGVPLSGPVLATPGAWILVGGTALDVERAEAPGYVLAFADGGPAGRSVAIARPLVVGSDRSADLVLPPDAGAAGRHARMTPAGRGVLVEDLGSPGGTFVNGLRVEQPMLAWPGDRVVLGRASLEIRPRPPAVPALQAVAGPAAGRSLVVDRPVELGRGPTAGFVLEGDELVSRLHARVSPVDGGLLVEDLGSRNGTTVNGEPVTRPTRLELGDVVGIGETLLKVVRAEDLAAPATAVRSAPGADEP